MPDEPQIPPQGGDDPNPDTEATQTGGAGPGAGEAGLVGIALLALYLIFFTLLVIYALVKIWPVPTPSRENPPTASASPSPGASAKPSPVATTSPTPTASATQSQTVAAVATQSPTASPTASPSPSPSVQPSKVTILGWEFDLWDEQRLLLLVILGGALGTLVHCLRSVYWYVGNRSLIKSWIAMYFMMPFAGAALSLVFYLVVRGGFFSPQSSFQQTSPFGFAAFSALIGMFSSQAVLKLKDVAEVLLSKPQGGANSKPQQTITPVISGTPPAAPTVSETPKVDGNPSIKT